MTEGRSDEFDGGNVYCWLGGGAGHVVAHKVVKTDNAGKKPYFACGVSFWDNGTVERQTGSLEKVFEKGIRVCKVCNKDSN
jgi:hypothetical protein